MKNIILIGGIIFSLSNNIAIAKEKLEATVDWAQRVELTIPVQGIVKKVNVNAGQIVKKGDVLVELDSRILSANLRKAKAHVTGLTATYKEVKRELDRAIELYDRTVLSDHDLQVAKNNEIVAKSNLEDAKSNHVKAKVELEISSLVAPFDSIILKRNVEIGMAIINRNVYQKLITLASSKNYLAKASITATQSDLFSIGQEVKVTYIGKTYNAKVVAIEYGIDSSAGKSTLVVMFTSNNKKLHAGTTVAIEF